MNNTQKTEKIIGLLQSRHQPPEWASWAELSVGTGGMMERRFDFYAFHTWPSKRYLKVAYEVKVSRSDFFREITKPRKRERAEEFADECYFAVPCGLVNTDEVPEGWGLIEMVANGLRVKKIARQRKVGTLPLWFVASLARRSSDSPEFPESVWLVAGEEVGAEALADMASAEVLGTIDNERRAAVEKFKTTNDKYLNLLELREVIERHVGYWEARNPSNLGRWFMQHEEGKGSVLDKGLVTHMRRLHTRLGEVLHRVDGE